MSTIMSRPPSIMLKNLPKMLSEIPHKFSLTDSFLLCSIMLTAVNAAIIHSVTIMYTAVSYVRMYNTCNYSSFNYVCMYT